MICDRLRFISAQLQPMQISPLIWMGPKLQPKLSDLISGWHHFFLSFQSKAGFSHSSSVSSIIGKFILILTRVKSMALWAEHKFYCYLRIRSWEQTEKLIQWALTLTTQGKNNNEMIKFSFKEMVISDIMLSQHLTAVQRIAISC